MSVLEKTAGASTGAPREFVSMTVAGQLFGIPVLTVQDVLGEWVGKFEADAKRAFPEKVTAFREGMAVHGRYGQPCPVCGSPVQRIVYAENESNYCATCQTGGRLLADRAMSRLLKEDWPRSIDEWDAHLEQRRG